MILAPVARKGVRIKNALIQLLAKLHAFWLIRSIVMTADQRREYALERALESHPDLQLIAAKIRSLQLSPTGEAGSLEARKRSEQLDQQIQAYDLRLSQLKVAMQSKGD